MPQPSRRQPIDLSTPDGCAAYVAEINRLGAEMARALTPLVVKLAEGFQQTQIAQAKAFYAALERLSSVKP